ncbi:uncharacterized protein LAESUDRAFT_724746 [Laetiporus sulphureus 93-53]|uniref:Uncharacterized protein n=1 Tax=Laetiporus sulphureus 93-53 TaxID=1314785 RepID=A0A165ETV6_9APHY|nr:uncharacterized protein LAESUDRAFT_724746 [Laetiporus sulphureus 93-53]KZT07750.1 hypothetical protein LAESUDRAFT_724746 [Laetiporus sulphureus 93-53]
MSFELNILSSIGQAQETDRVHPQDSIENDQGVADPRSMVGDVSTAGDPQQDVNKEGGLDKVEQEMLLDEEDDV